MFLSSTKNQLSFLLKAGKTTKKPNNKASTITVADLNVGETTVWLTISNTKYDNCMSEGSMVVVNQTLNPKVKAEVLTTANSSVVLVADEPPANATKHFWQIVESAPDATLENAGSNETMAHNLREGINKFKWVLQNDDCADAVDVTVTRTTPSIPAPELRDGFYQLATTENFNWFVDQVNSGNTKINAMLIKDIVINADCLSHLSLSKKDNEEFDIVEWQPIGTPDNPYGGTFNGGGYSISGLYINSDTDDNVGLFDTVGEDGTVKNVGVEDSYIKGDENVGAICGNNQGTILNCYNTSIVQGNENVHNCYYLTENPDNTDPQARTVLEFKSGEVAKSLVEGAPSEFVLEVFNLDNVLPGVDHITAPATPTIRIRRLERFLAEMSAFGAFPTSLWSTMPMRTSLLSHLRALLPK